MTRFQYINDNLDQVKTEVKMGLVSITVLSHYAIYSRYDYYRKLGNYVGFSVLFTADSCRVSESLVYKVIKEMEESV